MASVHRVDSVAEKRRLEAREGLGAAPRRASSCAEPMPRMQAYSHSATKKARASRVAARHMLPRPDGHVKLAQVQLLHHRRHQARRMPRPHQIVHTLRQPTNLTRSGTRNRTLPAKDCFSAWLVSCL